MPDKSRNPFVVEVEQAPVVVHPKVVTKPEPTPPPQPPAAPVAISVPAQKPSQPHLVAPSVKKVAHKAQPQWGMFFAGMGTAFLLSGATYGGWMLYSKQSVPATPQPTPTPLVGVLLPPDTATPSTSSGQAPALTASSWSKGLIKVDVLNGTGVVGKAGTILTKIVGLGYKKGTTGNAADQTRSTLALTSDVATLSAEIVKDFEPLVGKITVSEKPLKGIGLVQVTVGK